MQGYRRFLQRRTVAWLVNVCECERKGGGRTTKTALTSCTHMTAGFDRCRKISPRSLNMFSWLYVPDVILRSCTKLLLGTVVVGPLN